MRSVTERTNDTGLRFYGGADQVRQLDFIAGEQILGESY